MTQFFKFAIKIKETGRWSRMFGRILDNKLEGFQMKKGKVYHGSGICVRHLAWGIVILVVAFACVASAFRSSGGHDEKSGVGYVPPILQR